MWIGTTVMAQNITGGYLAWIMVCYSFIADNTKPRDRVLRLGAVSFVIMVR